MSTETRPLAYSLLSKILWERRFKKRKNYAVVSGGKMNEEEYQRLLTVMDEIKNKK